jgi:hypothetical protein
MSIPFHTVSAAYARGLADGSPDANPNDTWAPKNMHEIEIGSACANWREALTDHAHTSYYGVERIRMIRAYWLGRCRAMRRVRGYGA